MSSTGTQLGSDCAAVAESVRSGDPAAVEDLYAILSKLVGASLLRAVGPQCFEDSLHEIVVIVLETIQTGGLRDSERLLAFMRTVARRQMVAHIRGAIDRRRRFVEDVESTATPGRSPEASAAYRERIEDLRAVLRRLSLRDQEIIERFYFREQDRGQICGEMQLTGTQFRLYKSRALAKCSRLAQFARARPVPLMF
jgi:RNA polymerase sigma factor (sigma-70 family)